MGGLLELNWPHSRAGGCRRAERATETRDADSRRYSSCFHWEFRDCEDVAFSAGYSAAISARCGEQSSFAPASRIIPQTVSQHFPQLIVVSW
jgi:hypothetical protein